MFPLTFSFVSECYHQLHLDVYYRIRLGCLQTWQLHHINMTRVLLLGFWHNMAVAIGSGRWAEGPDLAEVHAKTPVWGR